MRDIRQRCILLRATKARFIIRVTLENQPNLQKASEMEKKYIINISKEKAKRKLGLTREQKVSKMAQVRVT